MQKFRFTAALLSVCALPMAAAQPHNAHHDAPHWSYAGAEGPAHWGGLSSDYAECSAGKNQSPVDLSRAAATSERSVVFHYQPARYRVENNGHALQATPEGGGQFVRIGGESFALKQFHFHAPSEHTFKGRHFPLEAHFVHQSTQGALAVVAVVFDAGTANPALKPLLAKKLKPGQSVQLPHELDISNLFPADTAHFRLSGSLTTPPCSEGVNWVVMEAPVAAAAAQLKAAATIIGHPNNRPVQPLNARIVIEEAQ